MGITRSFNRQTGVYYAYETTYEWSEEKQKRVQKKRCIGQFIPGTDEVIPNGPRGKKPKGGTPVIIERAIDATSPNYANTIQSLCEIRAQLHTFERTLTEMTVAVHGLASEIDSCLEVEKT